MKNPIAWAVAGVIAACLAYLILMLAAHFGAPHLSVPVLSGEEGMRYLGQESAWGAAYGFIFWALGRHVLPAEVLVAGLLFAILPFLVTVLFLPLYHHHQAISEPWRLLWLAADNAVFSVLMVALGRQFEK